MMSDLASLRYFLGFEVISSPDGYFLSQQKYNQDIFDHYGLTDHLIAETPMELTFSFVLLMVSLSRIQLSIAKLLGALFTLVSLVLTFLMLFTFSVSLCVLLSFTIVTIFVFFAICGEPSRVFFSFHALAHYSSRHILMQPGPVIYLIANLFLPIVFSLAPLSLLGRQRNKPLYPARALRLS